MRVMMLTNAIAPDKLGGSYRYIRELSAALVRTGIEVTVVTKRVSADAPSEETGADGVRIVRHTVPTKDRRAFGLVYPFAVALGVARALRSDRRAIVHAHFPVDAMPVALSRRRYLYTFHAPVWRELAIERQGSYWLPEAAERAAAAALRVAESAVVRRAATAVVLSEFSRSQLRALAPRTARDSILIPGGVDLHRFRPGAVTAGSQYDAGKRPLLFTARRLVPRTGVAELVAAVAKLVQCYPGIRLVIAGSGGQEQPIRNLIERLDLADRVQLVGVVDEAQLVDWYRAADLVVIPTQLLEGFGLATVEALACGTPVLGTPAGATPELLRPIDPSLVADGVSADDLARALDHILAQPERLQALRAAARARVAPAMGWDHIAAAYTRLYRRLQGST